MILAARDKPILTSMKIIRRLLIKKLIYRQQCIAEMQEMLVPMAKKIIGILKQQARGYQASFRADDKFQLSGFLCVHRVTAIIKKSLPIKNFVHEAYTKEMYVLAYGKLIAHISGIRQ
ncbi:uncharacterized protein A4U43_C01F23810 [Asparagus officinalis]|uniref:Uncharacterized protein n=1 Tax=Asparagus officinalis TaxID=4686 RepID=A0A5P1FRX3_ASPOF|nr:uncharacterized protein A4U43_C01F23810 [Asparagus officinalis]